MIQAGRRSVWQEAQVVVPRGGEEATVKRLYREKGEAGETLRPSPENGGHEDLIVSAEDVIF